MRLHADLTAAQHAGDTLDLTTAVALPQNLGASFQGASKKAKFEMPTLTWRDPGCNCPTSNGRPNSDVLKPWANGFELSRRPQHQWIIDFGVELSLDAAPLALSAVCPCQSRTSARARAKQSRVVPTVLVALC
jgi:hypothetical protein